MDMLSMREQKFLDQLSCKINEENNLKWPTGGHFGFY